LRKKGREEREGEERGGSYDENRGSITTAHAQGKGRIKKQFLIWPRKEGKVVG